LGDQEVDILWRSLPTIGYLFRIGGESSDLTRGDDTQNKKNGHILRLNLGILEFVGMDTFPQQRKRKEVEILSVAFFVVCSVESSDDPRGVRNLTRHPH